MIKDLEMTNDYEIGLGNRSEPNERLVEASASFELHFRSTI